MTGVYPPMVGAGGGHEAINNFNRKELKDIYNRTDVFEQRVEFRKKIVFHPLTPASGGNVSSN